MTTRRHWSVGHSILGPTRHSQLLSVKSSMRLNKSLCSVPTKRTVSPISNGRVRVAHGFIFFCIPGWCTKQASMLSMVPHVSHRRQSQVEEPGAHTRLAKAISTSGPQPRERRCYRSHQDSPLSPQWHVGHASRLTHGTYHDQMPQCRKMLRARANSHHPIPSRNPASP
jgi:hypothetical protein